MTMSDSPRPLHVIAREIWENWANVNHAAVPYLQAMTSLDKVSDNYYQDSGVSIVRYFLANAGSWRGDVARRVKAELKGMVA